MLFTGKFRVLNDIHIYQMGCQGMLRVNTFVEYHLKLNSSYLWVFDLFLNKVLYFFSAHSRAVHITKAVILQPQRASVCEDGVNTWDHAGTR